MVAGDALRVNGSIHLMETWDERMHGNQFRAPDSV